MKYIVIIPARYSSSRLPGKPLMDICGKTMIERVAIQALKSGASRVIVATDDERIEQVCKNISVEVCMTSADHNSGTERIAEVVNKLNLADNEIIVNVQGDEPLIPPENITQVASLLEETNAPMSTLCVKIEGEEVFDMNCVKVIMNANKEAIYFSRAPIPYERNNFRAGNMSAKDGHARHIGIYAYRAGFIREYISMPPCALENIESLEQLRVLYYGKSIAVDYAKKDPQVGVDTIEDLKKVREIIEKQR
ncbi:MAG: 3-deoxy-manno-octulosonate cytidylyltransferase [Succinivibrionaceae bacterium]